MKYKTCFLVLHHGSSCPECWRTYNVTAITTVPILDYEDAIYQYEMKSQLQGTENFQW